MGHGTRWVSRSPGEKRRCSIGQYHTGSWVVNDRLPRPQLELSGRPATVLSRLNEPVEAKEDTGEAALREPTRAVGARAGGSPEPVVSDRYARGWDQRRAEPLTGPSPTPRPHRQIFNELQLRYSAARAGVLPGADGWNGAAVVPSLIAVGGGSAESSLEKAGNTPAQCDHPDQSRRSAGVCLARDLSGWCRATIFRLTSFTSRGRGGSRRAEIQANRGYDAHRARGNLRKGVLDIKNALAVFRTGSAISQFQTFCLRALATLLSQSGPARRCQRES